MKRRIFFIAICIYQLCSVVYPQTYGWKKIATLNAGRIYFIDSLHGWAAGTSAHIFRTTDGGTSWIQYSSDAPFNVNSISMVDSLNGWCVGFNGGNDGWIARTTDGGKTWPSQFERDRRQYVGNHAFSITDNITSGQTKHSSTPDTGKIIQTNDSGKSWTETTPFASSSAYNNMQFLDSLNGFVWGKPQMRTRDGGKTWQALPQDDKIESPSFIDTLRGWGGYQSTMFRTTDGGMTWNYQAYLDQPDQLSMTDLEFVDSVHGWAFGFMFYKGIITDAIFHTTNGGDSWYLEAVNASGSQTDSEISDAQMLNSQTGWAICSDGSVLKYQRTTSVVEKLPEQQPKSFILRQNFPNPFNPATTIEYEIQKRQTVTLFITDALGRRIETIVDNTSQEAGVYRATFDGAFLSSGIYFYTIQTDEFTDTKQMNLIK